MRYRFGNWSSQWFGTAAWCFGIAFISLVGGAVVAGTSSELGWGAFAVGAGLAVVCGALGAMSLAAWSMQYVEIDADRMVLLVSTLRSSQEFPAESTSARITGEPPILFPGSLQLKHGDGEWVVVNAIGQGHLRPPKQLTGFVHELASVGVEVELL